MDATNATRAELTITHNHADGTTLTGSRKGDGVWEVCKANGWRFSRHAGIYLPHSRDKDANRRVIDRTAGALRAEGFEVAEDIDNTPRSTAEREADRADRADRRADRYAERASKAAVESETRRAAADAISDRMPFGEPIKIGHHSERSHRRAFEKIHAHTEKSWEAADKAREMSHRAEAVGHNLAHRQDPRVTMRRIERLEVERRKLTRDYGERAAGKVARLTEEIEHWRAELGKLAESGAFVPWGPEHFRKGDLVNVRGVWYPVVRVNRKSVSVPPLIGLGRPNGADGQPWSWTDTAPWDDLGGRRRDGMQLDTPNGEPWPVDLAQKVARWEDLARWIGRDGHNEESRREARHVRWAQRIAHGLDLGAAQSEVEAFQPDPDDTDTRRQLAAAYLAVFDRLAAGERSGDIAASLPPMPELTPAWVVPSGEAQRMPVREVKPGDIIAGRYDNGFAGSGETLHRVFVGPVAEVIPHVGDEYSGERFVGYWVVVLSTGERHELKPWHMLAVHPAEPVAEVAAEPEPVAEVAEAETAPPADVADVVVYTVEGARPGVLVESTAADEERGAVRVRLAGQDEARPVAPAVVVPFAAAADAWHVVNAAGRVVAGGPGITRERCAEVAAEGPGHLDHPGPLSVVRGVPGVTYEPEPTAAERWQALVFANCHRPHTCATRDRTRRQAIARRRVCGVPDDYVGADFTDQHPGTYEEKAAAYLAAYAALLAADGATRTHPAEPEPTPDVAPPSAVVTLEPVAPPMPAAPLNPWDDLLAAHLHAA